MSMGPPFIPTHKELNKSQSFEDISAGIRAIKADKNKLRPMVTQKIKPVHVEQDYMTRPKKQFSHPKLNLVLGQMVNSPYLTKPLVYELYPF